MSLKTPGIIHNNATAFLYFPEARRCSLFKLLQGGPNIFEIIYQVYEISPSKTSIIKSLSLSLNFGQASKFIKVIAGVKVRVQKLLKLAVRSGRVL